MKFKTKIMWTQNQRVYNYVYHVIETAWVIVTAVIINEV